MEDKLAKTLSFFFTKEDFEKKPENFLSLLQRRYYQLAKKFHPDAGYSNPQTFLTLKESYLWLRVLYQKNPKAILVFFTQKKDIPKPIFLDYVKTIRAFHRALDEYYENVKNQKKDANAILVKKLEPLKRNLLHICEMAKGTIWEGDIENHIGRMEIWLKEKRF